jgi:hypothetical protein
MNEFLLVALVLEREQATTNGWIDTKREKY